MGLGFDGPNFRLGAFSLRSESWGGPMGPPPYTRFLITVTLL